MKRENITISAIKNYLQKETAQKGLVLSGSFTTAVMSERLNISRTLASQYLNGLIKSEEIIKVTTRPVYFFDKSTLERKFQTILNNTEYFSIEELQNELKNRGMLGLDFESVIGYYGSLSECIRQMKSALNYPGNGLPILLIGERGTGKTHLAKKAFEYLKNQKKITSKSHLRKISFNQANIVEEFQKLESLLKEKSDDLIYVDGCETFSLDQQMKLVKYLSDQESTKKRIIFSLNDKTPDFLNKELLLQIPVICKISGFDERFDDEKEQLIMKYFLQEAESLEREIFVTRKVIETLKAYSYKQQIDGLKNVVKNICASVYKPEQTNPLEIGLLDLPNDILNDCLVDYESTEEKINVCHYQKHWNDDATILFFEKLINCYYNYQDSLDINSFLEESNQLVYRYYDYLMFESDFPVRQVKALERIVNTVVKRYQSVVHFNLPLNSNDFLARMLYQASKQNSLLKKFEDDHEKELSEIDEIFSHHLLNEYVLSKKIVRLINQTVDCSLPKIANLFLSLNLRTFNHTLNNQEMIGIILTHGYMTASSMAEAVNTLLKAKVFEAIDMSLDSDVNSIVEKVNTFITNHPYYQNILLLVDMGSLEQIESKISASINIGVINHVSTALALNVGTKMMQNISMEDILQQVITETKYSYKIVSKARKEDAIVFTSDTGIKVSEKLIQLFQESLPQNIPLNFIDVDYNRLSKNEINDVVFKKYNVLLVIRPYGLQLADIPQVSLEDIINSKEITKVNHALQKYLSKDDITAFNQNLLKNFSLISIMENTMVLNATVLLDGVSESISMLERLMNYKLSSKMIVGIYIHICFLIERLVTKSRVEKEWDSTSFLEEHGDFVEYVQTCFAPLLANYNVKIPLEEISYLYDYFKHDSTGGDLND